VTRATGGAPASSAGVTHRFDLAGPGAVVRHLGTQAHASPLDGLAHQWAGDARAGDR